MRTLGKFRWKAITNEGRKEAARRRSLLEKEEVSPSTVLCVWSLSLRPTSGELLGSNYGRDLAPFVRHWGLCKSGSRAIRKKTRSLSLAAIYGSINPSSYLNSLSLFVHVIGKPGSSSNLCVCVYGRRESRVVITLGTQFRRKFVVRKECDGTAWNPQGVLHTPGEGLQKASGLGTVIYSLLKSSDETSSSTRDGMFPSPPLPPHSGADGPAGFTYVNHSHVVHARKIFLFVNALLLNDPVFPLFTIYIIYTLFNYSFSNVEALLLYGMWPNGNTGLGRCC